MVSITRWIGLGIVACVAGSEAAAQPVLQKIFDSDDPVPGLPDASWHASGMIWDMAVDDGEVVFIGVTDSPNENEGWGIYRYRGGPLERVVGAATPRPRSSGVFQSFNSVAMDGGLIAFTSGFQPPSGVYTIDDGPIEVVADNRTQIPGAGSDRFVRFAEVAVDGGTVLFTASDSSEAGIAWHADGLYVGVGGLVARVVDSSTPVPAAGGQTFDGVGWIGFDGTGHAFTRPVLNVSVEDGIYRSSGDRVLTVADLSTISPFSGEPFEDFRAFAYDDGAVAFLGTSAGRRAVYLHDGELRTMASPDTPFPGRDFNFFGFFNRVATSEKHVAFGAFANQQSGLFLSDGSTVSTVIEVGEELDGRVVMQFGFDAESFDWPDLYFAVGFEDGGSALYRYNVDGRTAAPPPGPWLTSASLPGYRVKARITAAGQSILGEAVEPCVADTLCVAGAQPDRPELFVRVVGPKPNGKLWPTLVKFSTSRVEVWVEKEGEPVLRYYNLDEVKAGATRLDLEGLADKLGFDP